MQLYKRYLEGNTVSVYNDIYKLEEKNLLHTHIRDVELVLEETFKRVAFNLNIIYNALLDIGYHFNTDEMSVSKTPLQTQPKQVKHLLDALHFHVSDFGCIPLALQYFYKVIDGVDFTWDYRANTNILWPLADPIQIPRLSYLVKQVTPEYWKEDMKTCMLDANLKHAFLELSADSLHKDNISGGPAYALQLPKTCTVDAVMLNTPYRTTFINYLRTCMDNCGFPGTMHSSKKASFTAFYNLVKPQLQHI